MEKSLNRNAFLFSSATVTTGGNGAKDTVEMQEPEVPASSPSGLRRDPYRGVILVLLLAALVGTAAAIVGGVMTSNAVLFEVSITLGLAAGILTGVAMAQSARLRLTASDQPIPQPAPADAETESAVQSPQKLEPSILIRRLRLIYTRGRQWLQTLGALGTIRIGTAIAGTIAVFSVLMLKLPENRPDPLLAGVIGSVCLLAAGLAAIAARYLGQIDLLGNGRDLITIDAAVQYRITDPRAWRYHAQNPADALRAIAYRVVMRSTVNRTLADALSENVQQEANALGLGVEVVGFTVGGMHPPVPVAGDYEAVVSAELGKVTSVVNAQAFRNESVPAAEAAALVGQNTARAEGAETLARGAGEAWSFRTLESQYHAAPEEYFFRRRLETLEKNLAGRSFVVVDSRIQRDGGDLWLMQ
jgi:hypothetical protein